LITFKVETAREDDGRWLAEVLELPGVLAYGESEDAALSRVQALALRVVAERLEHGEAGPELLTICSTRVTAWPSTRARRVLAALLRIGWKQKRR
jgi:predicted RNase H-like HicB family nuclease